MECPVEISSLAVMKKRVEEKHYRKPETLPFLQSSLL